MVVGPYYESDSMYYKDSATLEQNAMEYLMEEGFTKSDIVHKREVCGSCGGGRTHVNPSIDGQGLDPNDPDLDDEFWEGYWGGRYDVTCYECNGRNVVDVLDEQASNPEAVKLYHEYMKDHYDSIAENLAELRMGA